MSFSILLTRFILGKGSHKQRCKFLEDFVDANVNEMQTLAWAELRQEFQERVNATRKTLEMELEKALRSLENQVDLFLDNVLGNGDNAKRLTLQEMAKKLLSEWHEDWAFPRSQEEQHMLHKDLRIPSVLRNEDLHNVKAELGDSGDESGSFSDDESESD